MLPCCDNCTINLCYIMNWPVTNKPFWYAQKMARFLKVPYTLSLIITIVKMINFLIHLKDALQAQQKVIFVVWIKYLIPVNGWNFCLTTRKSFNFVTCWLLFYQWTHSNRHKNLYKGETMLHKTSKSIRWRISISTLRT